MKFEGKKFFNSPIALDNNQFYECAFDSCVLVYRGGIPPNIAKCSFKNTFFGFSGPAANTLLLIAIMYHAGFKDTIEMVLKNVGTDVNVDEEKIIFN